MIAPNEKYELALFNKISGEANKLSNLTFIEKVPFSEIQNYFNGAKMFIGTSDFEGFPNTYLQACIGGTPIVSLRINPDNFITTHNLGYCADGNMETMVEQIEKLLTNPADWKEKSANAYLYVKTYHDIKEVKKLWDSIIRSVL